MNRLLFIFSFCCITLFSNAQNVPAHDFLIAPEAHYGFIISHHSNMVSLIKGHIYGAELNYIFRTDGTKTWQQINKYPEIGVCFLHLYLGNPEQLGNVEALYPYLNVRLNKRKRALTLNLRIGVGLAYVTKCFDRIENHKNIILGSHLNGFVNLRLNSTVMLSKSLRLQAGVGLSHASNGAFKTPNLGINMATVNLGLAYVFGNKELILHKDSISPAKKQWHPSVIFVVGAKELSPPGGGRYAAMGIQFNYYKTLNYRNRLGTGIEMVYNTANIEDLRNDSISNPTFTDVFKCGTKISYEFVINKLSLPIDFGVYLYQRKNFDGLFFHRIGLRYMINKHLIANVTLRTNWAKADYFEWGIGYQL